MPLFTVIYIKVVQQYFRNNTMFTEPQTQLNAIPFTVYNSTKNPVNNWIPQVYDVNYQVPLYDH